MINQVKDAVRGIFGARAEKTPETITISGRELLALVSGARLYPYNPDVNSPADLSPLTASNLASTLVRCTGKNIRGGYAPERAQVGDLHIHSIERYLATHDALKDLGNFLYERSQQIITEDTAFDIPKDIVLNLVQNIEGLGDYLRYETFRAIESDSNYANVYEDLVQNGCLYRGILALSRKPEIAPYIQDKPVHNDFLEPRINAFVPVFNGPSRSYVEQRQRSGIAFDRAQTFYREAMPAALHTYSLGLKA